MYSYYNHDQDYHDHDNLDKMARDINNSHKNKTYKDNCPEIDYVVDSSNIVNNYSYINANNNTLEETKSRSIDSINSSFADLSNNSSSNSSSNSSYLSLSPKLKKKFELNNDHLKNLNGNDENTMFHVQNCDKCREQLIKLLGKHITNNEINNNILNLSTPELKDVLILIFGGIIIIILLDLILNRK
jgi:hypothetical protein